MKETLLLTGFEPFGTWGINPSWEIAQSLDGQTIDDLHVVARRLPVNWQSSWTALEQAIKETQPRWVLMLGQAGKRSHISVESRGLNACGDSLDNAGQPAPNKVITVEGADEMPSTLPIDEIVSRISKLGLPVERSESAGGYLCNHTFYKALSWVASRADAPAIGFIHVPALAGANPTVPGMPLEDMVRAVRAAISVLTMDDGRW